MQNISGEAMATGDQAKLEWCNNYTKKLREIELRKFDEITAHIFEYMEAYSRRTEEEIAQAKAQGKARGGKTDISMREFIKLTEPST
jgi:hypothetical protein